MHDKYGSNNTKKLKNYITCVNVEEWQRRREETSSGGS